MVEALGEALRPRADLPGRDSFSRVAQTQIWLKQHKPEAMKLPKGKALNTRGQHERDVFFQTGGLTMLECVSARGERVLVEFGLPGDFVEVGSWGGDITCTVRAIVDTDLLRLSKANIGRLTSVDEQVRSAYVSALEERLIRSRRHMVAVSGRSAMRKVSGLVIELGAQLCGGAAGAGPADLWIPVSQTQLAAAAGLTLPAVNRAVRLLRDAGTIEWTSAGVRILAGERLRMAASGWHGRD